MELTVQQLAQLLLGVARAQQAIIDALENSKAGFKASHFRPAVETAARIRANRAETLAEFPARLLLQMMNRTAPDTDSVMRELEKLLSQPELPASADPAAATAPPAPRAPASGDDSLDITR
jgi:hypothetical protein